MSKILVVDDEPTIVELLEEHLRSEGYDTMHAYSGEEALRVLQQDTPDLMLLDLMLPGMDGYEVCRLMQQDARLNHIPVIMLTARSSVPNKVLGYEKGADDYVVKPFDAEELSVRVRAQLHHLYHEDISELTGLPGSQAVEDTIAARTIDPGGPWAIVYVDINNFAAFNESYSYRDGDEMIKEAAGALVQALGDQPDPRDFLGHMGGPQFVLITTPDRAHQLIEFAQSLFRENTQHFYSPADREQGFLVTIDHQGLMTHRPLPSLDCDIVSSDQVEAL